MEVHFTREIEVYENERYIPLSGWSSKGLMMTDRSAYSTEDGSANFSNTDEASNQLTSDGWSPSPDSKWTVDVGGPNMDEAGWSYATDFGGADEAYKAEKGIASFVRRRKLKRAQIFTPEFLCSDIESMTCDNVDLELLYELSKSLLNAVLGNSINKHPRQISGPKINLIKNALITALRLKGRPQGMKEVFSTLTQFASEGSSAFSVMSAAVSSSNAVEGVAKRYQQCNEVFFTPLEREALARTIVRKHDVENYYHCKTPNCGQNCVFAPMTCPNENCTDIFSNKWAGKHDNICPQKIIECDRLCGETMPRISHDNHKEHACALSVLGCMAELVSKTLPDHMDCCTQSHLLLSLNRTLEHQHVMQNINTKMVALESQCVSQARQIKVLTASVTAAAVAVEVSEKRLLKNVHDEIVKSDSKLTRKADDVASESNREITKINKALSELALKEKEKERLAARK